MLINFLKATFIITFVLSDEITLLSKEDTDVSDWNSTQNDKDDDIGRMKWVDMGTFPDSCFYVCRIQGQKQDNFLRTPFVKTLGVKLVYVEIEYSLTACTNSHKEVSRDNCEQSFHLHKKESSNPEDTDRVDEYTYPLANEDYTSIVPGTFNEKTTIEIPVTLSGDYKGVFFAFRDRGACVRIFDVRVKYRFCPENTINAVQYNETILDGEDIQVTGTCVDNSQHPDSDPPIKYCRVGTGMWEHDFQKSDCFCDPGYELKDQICQECESGWYKPEAGNSEPCIKCPANSMSLPGYTYKCECVEGYSRVTPDNFNEGCIEPPDPPKGEEIVMLDKTQFSVRYQLPEPVVGLKYKIKVSQKIDDDTVITLPSDATITDNTATINDLQPDREYIISFRVHNGSAESEGIVKLFTTASEANNQLYIIIIVSLGVLILFILVVATIIFCRKKKRSSKFGRYTECRDPMLEHGKTATISTQSGSLQHRKYVPVSKYASDPDSMRNINYIENCHISLERIFGQGQFGDVWKGTFHPPGHMRKDIAAKVLRDGSNIKQQKDFLAEAFIMVQFDDPNIIELLGVVRNGERIMIITEFMRNGSLKDYLKEIEGKRSILDLVTMARGIASGMKYLAEMNFIHRDLAARNILVDDRGVCKVADFGLSRILEEDSHYYKPQGGQIPVRWTAPEAIVHRKYTQKSDVYSMGVLLWEMVTYGAEPWGNVSNDEVLRYLKDRVKLPRPESCSQIVYDVMLDCWQEDYTKRPTFSQLCQKFDVLILNFRERSTFPTIVESMNSIIAEEYVLSVAQWLDGMGLSQYQSHFVNTGWDTIDKLVLMEEEDLQKIGITLAGHKKKIMTAIDCMKAYTPYTLPATLPAAHSGAPFASLAGPKFGTLT